MHMSKTAIYEQLVSEYGEEFTEEEAQYAIDNIEADSLPSRPPSKPVQALIYADTVQQT